MNDRRRVKAVLNYEAYDRLPIVHFGYWPETLQKWTEEGHLTQEELAAYTEGSWADDVIAKKLGFDCDYNSVFYPGLFLNPYFEAEVLEELPDGSRKVRNHEGVIVLDRPGAGGIPAEIDHLLKGRKEWEEHYLPRLQFHPDRVNKAMVRVENKFLPFDEGGLEYLKRDDREYLYGLHLGSLFGHVRNILGVVGSSMLFATDSELFDEMINTTGDLCYNIAKMILESGAKFDFAHYWEDICFKNGPLIIPSVFEEKVGPHYRRINDLVKNYGINIISLDCDGWIDALIPTWLGNGVNTMFPIEVGTWDASIKPWREQYGRELRGVGGMNKVVFAYDYAAIDAEIERLKPLVELGGYIPCPDHRIPPDAKWENVQYYCARMRETFRRR